MDIDQQVERRLREHDIRYTSGRRTVVAALDGADGPRSAAELSDDLDGIVPLSSLYRSLAVLEEAGVVVPHHGTKGLTRYELAEWLSGHHHHLVCIGCGSVDDVDVPAQHEETVRELVAAIGEMAAFSATSHVLEIEGRCAQCA